MANAIVQTAHGVIADITAGGSLSFTKPTITGNAVVVIWIGKISASGNPNLN